MRRFVRSPLDTEVEGTAGGAAGGRGNAHRQLTVFAALLAVYVLSAFATYAWFPLNEIAPTQTRPSPLSDVPGWLLGLANAGIVLVVYGALGLTGFWCARRLGWPGIFREGAGWRAWLVVPLALGLGLGVAVTALDRLRALLWPGVGFAQPAFPLSLFVSVGAGIGEETLFRAFVLGLWALVLQVFVRRWVSSGTRFWIANGLAALLFGAAHLPAEMLLLGVSSPARIPPPLLVEIFLLNGAVGAVAGVWYRQVGLVAAVGIHVWADVVWHVLWPLAGLGI